MNRITVLAIFLLLTIYANYYILYMSMISIAFITFRESLEVLLVVGALFTSLGHYKIHKKRDLVFGCISGILFSITLFVISSFAGSKIHIGIESEVSELFEGVNYLVSGIFLFITAILLHNKMKQTTPSLLLDTSLFAVGFLLTLREGIEIIIFSASSTILSSFQSSVFGFIMGLFFTILIGIGGTLISSRFSHKRMLLVVDWGIKLLSVYFIFKGFIWITGFID